MTTADVLAASRLDGDTLSIGCLKCPLLGRCGGYRRAAGTWSCMDLCGSCDRTTCDKVCLKKPEQFAEDLLEIGGFGFEGIPALLRLQDAPLPRYVPAIQHGIRETEPVSLPWAAVPLSRLLRFEKRRYVPAVTTAAALRRMFSLGAETRVILLGVGKDRPIENYWRWRRVHAVTALLSTLDFAAAIAPNYSFFLEDPRPQHLFNRKRSLICAAEFSRAGIPPVVCLQAVAPADWTYWEEFLGQHPETSTVAEDFQTGLARRERGLPAIERIARLQDRVGRKLHLIAVGGGQYARELATHFDGWTVIDSIPFMKATHRRLAGAAGARVSWTRALDGDVGEMLEHNAIRWSDWLLARAQGEAGTVRARRTALRVRVAPSAA
jgi:hypothetical protein